MRYNHSSICNLFFLFLFTKIFIKWLEDYISMLYNSNGLYTKYDLSQCTNNIQPSTMVILAQLLYSLLYDILCEHRKEYLYIYKNFLYFGIIIYSQEMAQICRWRSHARVTYSSPMLPSIIQCQNQKIDIGTVRRVYSDFTSYIYNHLRVSVFACVLQCNSITNAPAVTTRNRYRTLLSPQAPLSCYTCNLSFSSLAITNPLISIILLFHECSVNRIV